MRRRRPSVPSPGRAADGRGTCPCCAIPSSVAPGCTGVVVRPCQSQGSVIAPAAPDTWGRPPSLRSATTTPGAACAVVGSARTAEPVAGSLAAAALEGRSGDPPCASGGGVDHSGTAGDRGTHTGHDQGASRVPGGRPAWSLRTARTALLAHNLLTCPLGARTVERQGRSTRHESAGTDVRRQRGVRPD